MTKEQFSQFGPMVSLNEAYLTHEINQRKEAAEATKAELENRFLEQAGGTPDQQQGRYRSILENLAAHKAVPQSDLD